MWNIKNNKKIDGNCIEGCVLTWFWLHRLDLCIQENFISTFHNLFFVFFLVSLRLWVMNMEYQPNNNNSSAPQCYAISGWILTVIFTSNDKRQPSKQHRTTSKPLKLTQPIESERIHRFNSKCWILPKNAE